MRCEDGEDLSFFTRRHFGEVKAAPQLGRHLVEFLLARSGGNFTTLLTTLIGAAALLLAVMVKVPMRSDAVRPRRDLQE
jgi:hypothetical protein